MHTRHTTTEMKIPAQPMGKIVLGQTSNLYCVCMCGGVGWGAMGVGIIIRGWIYFVTCLEYGKLYYNHTVNNYTDTENETACS